MVGLITTEKRMSKGFSLQAHVVSKGRIVPVYSFMSAGLGLPRTSTLLDPAVNILIQRMKKELDDPKKKLEDTQNDLNAWKFTPDR